MEKHLNIFATEYMEEWSLEKFKITHPTLFKAIIDAGECYVIEQVINKESEKTRH